jgi:beta-phosphoglucomutase-like phosphatase (HAD superfamily)
VTVLHWTIVTSGTKPLADVRIRAAGIPPPERFITAQDIVIGKPDPELYVKGAAFAPEDCVVVEDAPAGIRSGKAAGARIIAVQTTESNDVLIELGADWIVKDCSFLALERTAQSGDLIIEMTLSGDQPLHA